MFNLDLSDILHSLLFTLLGWLVRPFSDSMVVRWRNRKEYHDSSESNKWLIDYYFTNQSEYLFTLQNGKRIPYLTKPNWNWPIFDHSKFNLYFDIRQKCSAPINDKLIQSRKDSGQKLWNGPILVLNGISEDNSGINIGCKKGTYFQYATVANQLRSETYQCARMKSRKPMIRNRIASTINKLANGDVGAQIIGVTTAVVLKLHEGHKILFQQRSFRTGIAGGFNAVIPAFVCNPDVVAEISSSVNLSDILFHYFLMEFLEELYDKEDLMSESEKYLNPKWFYKIDPVPDMIELKQKNLLNFEVLGFGFDGNTGELNIACTAFINDEKFCESERFRMKRNWEADDIQLLSMEDTVLLGLIHSEETYVTSAYTLACLLKRVKTEPGYDHRFGHSNRHISYPAMLNQSLPNKKIDDLQRQWNLLQEKLSGLEEQRILETRHEEKLRLKKLIDDANVQRDQVEKQLKDIESQLAKVSSEAKEGAGQNDDNGPETITMKKLSILFLAAEPTDTSRLRLGEEFRQIDEQLNQAKQRDHFNLELPQLSLRPKDIARALLNAQPQIVHFSGHGTSEGNLCFENEKGESHLVQPEALAALFEQFSNQINCVLLNACYSEIQAQAIAKHIEYVIGMNQAIGDRAAIAFAIGFYQALGAGRTIEEAYKFGCVQIQLQSIPEHLTPVLVKKFGSV